MKVISTIPEFRILRLIFLQVASLDIILFNKQLTKVLARLWGCRMVFAFIGACNKIRFSCDTDHITSTFVLQPVL